MEQTSNERPLFGERSPIKLNRGRGPYIISQARRIIKDYEAFPERRGNHTPIEVIKARACLVINNLER